MLKTPICVYNIIFEYTIMLCIIAYYSIVCRLVCNVYVITILIIPIKCIVIYRSSLMSSATDSSEVNSVSSEDVNVAQEDEQLPPRPGISIYIIYISINLRVKTYHAFAYFLRKVINK